MLIPKKVKHRKWQKGRSRKRETETRGMALSHGSFGLQALEAKRINSKQIEAARKTLTNFIKREGKIWIRIFPDKPVTQRPPEVTMGGGKGNVDHYIFAVKPGRVIFEMDGVSDATAERALTLAGFKLPFRTRIIKKS
ncbi:MAG: 50S ribosomal protein L16 [Patescibacteria group bacterium]|nr:50S ribosomal protein L16 [Patescibacteria group bacterium]MCL5261709.1 50S ribosomal protein L16 [Patescibacteria group bacterium]